uniref:Cytochrome c oxidase subunit 3 n=1 Tax=Echinoderes svetlanae TaxID=1912903 RepID=A0A1I9VTU7_9BILA|nr:cytochrome c oxidase subunit III [Echinoderes svetlanae]APA17420.1 cytochrome c oxidase subunit 3 [Echinoderes svetlanae]
MQKEVMHNWPLSQNNPYQLVSKSPWPVMAAFMGFCMALGLINFMHCYSTNLMFFGLLFVSLVSIFWWRDVIREATFQGQHTQSVIGNLRLGFLLFIGSEVMFFFSFFWAFFHSSLAPAVWIGCQWPPSGIVPLNFLATPLLNTVILLSSGATVTVAHVLLRNSKGKEAGYFLVLTVMLGVLFTSLQVKEYLECPFTVADSAYGSAFFLMTGFHGAHVLIGTGILIVQTFRTFSDHFLSYHHFGLDAAIWYWHFVDVVWLFLYTWVYAWGS